MNRKQFDGLGLPAKKTIVGRIKDLERAIVQHHAATTSTGPVSTYELLGAAYNCGYNAGRGIKQEGFLSDFLSEKASTIITRAYEHERAATTRAAIEEVELYTDWLTTHETGDYLTYHQMRIKELEKS